MNTKKVMGFENLKRCKDCGGKCCKNFPGAYFPGDYGFEEITVENLLKMFRTGKIAVDWWFGSLRGIPEDEIDSLGLVYYIRPKRKGVEALVDFDFIGDYTCIFLASDGCELPFHQRPLNCRMLKPGEKEGERCRVDNNYTKEGAVIAWIPYQDIIKKAIILYEKERNHE